jgi:phytoene/squalene synthetase
VRVVYALVRVADEVVDGAAVEAGLSVEEARAVLDDLEAETSRAVERGFSADLIVHAFAQVARECAIGADLVAPFFASMRADTESSSHDAASHDVYVYGSAEVVGLMCLQVFVNAGHPEPVQAPAHLVDGARRLGAAFQDVNFLRDLEHDADVLGRDYLGIADGTTRDAVLDRIDGDLAAAAAVIPDLPADCRAAVTAAHDLFADLSARLRRADPSSGERVRVPDAVKAALAVRAWLGASPRRTTRGRSSAARPAGSADDLSVRA